MTAFPDISIHVPRFHKKKKRKPVFLGYNDDKRALGISSKAKGRYLPYPPTRERSSVRMKISVAWKSCQQLQPSLKCKHLCTN